MNVVTILKQLVEIPSYPDLTEEEQIKKDNGKDVVACSCEEELAGFIENFLKRSPLNLSFEKQEVIGKRYNLIARDCPLEDVKLWFFCHMDTVNPSEGQCKDSRMTVSEEDNCIYGLGSVDMKGGTAALLSVVSELSLQTKGLGLIFYCDEELNFAGMEEIIKNKFQGELAVFCEPTDLEITPGCRGVVEINTKVWGERVHASRPYFGNNAILIAVNAFKDLLTEITSPRYLDEQLGFATCNLGWIKGGIWDDEKKRILSSGNNVPDVAEIVLECRNTKEQLVAIKFLAIFENYVKKYGGKLGRKNEEGVDIDTKIIHDKKWMKSDKKDLEKVEKALKQVGLKVKYSKIDEVGYYDSAMFKKATGITCVSLGPGPHGMSHKKGEYVTIESLEKSKKVYLELIKEFCTA